MGKSRLTSKVSGITPDSRPPFLTYPGVIVVFPLDTELDLLRSVHSLTAGTNFLRTTSGGGGGGGAITPTGFNTPITGPGQVTLLANTSTIVFPANTTRAFARIVNYGSTTIYIQYFIAAVLQTGVPVRPFSSLTVSGFDLTYGDITAISASDCLIDILEAGY